MGSVPSLVRQRAGEVPTYTHLESVIGPKHEEKLYHIMAVQATPVPLLSWCNPRTQVVTSEVEASKIAICRMVQREPLVWLARLVTASFVVLGWQCCKQFNCIPGTVYIDLYSNSLHLHTPKPGVPVLV